VTTGGRFPTRGTQRLVTSTFAKGIDVTGLDFSKLTRLIVTVEKGPVRYRVDSNVTLTAEGLEGSNRKNTNAVFHVWGEADMRAFQFISLDEKSVVINVGLEGSGSKA